MAACDRHAALSRWLDEARESAELTQSLAQSQLSLLLSLGPIMRMIGPSDSSSSFRDKCLEANNLAYDRGWCAALEGRLGPLVCHTSLWPPRSLRPIINTVEALNQYSWPSLIALVHPRETCLADVGAGIARIRKDEPPPCKPPSSVPRSSWRSVLHSLESGALYASPANQPIPSPLPARP